MTSHCLWRFKLISGSSCHSSKVFVSIGPDRRPTDRSGPIPFMDRSMDRLIGPVRLHLKNRRSYALGWIEDRTGPRLSIPGSLGGLSEEKLHSRMFCDMHRGIEMPVHRFEDSPSKRE